jgi:hypothetical protein
MLASFQLTIAPKRQRRPGLEAVSQGNDLDRLAGLDLQCCFVANPALSIRRLLSSRSEIANPAKTGFGVGRGC